MGGAVAGRVVLKISQENAVSKEVVIDGTNNNYLINHNSHDVFRIYSRVNSKKLPIEQSIAIRIGDDLKLIFSINSSVVFKSYFESSNEDKSFLEIAYVINEEASIDEFSDKNTDDNLSYFVLPADSSGLDIGGNAQLLLAIGDVGTLLQLAQDEPGLINALKNIQNGPKSVTLT